MLERIGPSVEKKCANCLYGHQIVSFVAGGSVDEEGIGEHWHTTEPNPIGQTRECFTWFEKWWYEPRRFIYPGHDDSCVNLKKFEPKPGLPLEGNKPRIK